MNLLRITREAKETIRQETDERIKVARLLVMRDMMVAVAVAVLIMILTMPTPSHPNRIGWFFLFPVLLIGIAIVGAISSRRHKSTTPEMDRARTVQMLLAIPGTVIVATLLSWALQGDLSSAIEVGAYGGLGGSIATVCTFWKSRRG